MKQRLAVLGGGMSSLVAVFELTNQPNWKDRWEIDVYQEGFRLGGKGASGRNQTHHDRIEEHGLHILFGFYDNAFRVMKECYQELGRHPEAPLATFEKAFVGDDLIVMMEKIKDGAGKEQWLPWPLQAPTNDGVPGSTGIWLTPWDYLESLLTWTVAQIHQFFGLTHSPADVVSELLADFGGDILKAVDKLLDTGEDIVREVESSIWSIFGRLKAKVLPGHPPEAATIQHGPKASLLVHAAWELSRGHNEEDTGILTSLVKQFRTILWGESAQITALGGITTDLRRLRLLIDFGLAVVTGLIEDGLLFGPPNWFKVDDVDFRTWLAKHGANRETLESPLVQGLYDAAYATWAPPGAGTTLHGFLRLAFTYKGSIYYRMQAGMGDTIFTPLYDVLKNRGVKFHYFHQVERLELSADRVSVAKIHMGIQATPKPEIDGGEYNPLVTIRHLPCWPSEPKYDLLVEGVALKASGQDLENWWNAWPYVGKKTIEAGVDYDQVLLGISIGAFPWIAKELIEDPKNPAFAAMCAQVKTGQTLGVQLWLRPGLDQLGWKGPRDAHGKLRAPIVIPYAEPLDTWADMSHLLQHEDWPAYTCANLAYLTASMVDEEPMPLDRQDHTYPARQTARVVQKTREWLDNSTGELWHHAVQTNNPNQFNDHWLVGDFADQYFRAPLSPSERYVLAVPNSSKYRLRASQSGYQNLTMCGDWTLTAMSVGCLEGATMGGMQAAKALDPHCPDAIGDWLPKLPPGPTPPPPPPQPPAPSTLPLYIPMDGNQIAVPPIRIDVDVRMFILEANYQKLWELCDAQLNNAARAPGESSDSGTVYRPLAPIVVLYASTVDNYPQVDPIGWVPEKDFGIWVPLVAGRMIAGIFVPERIVTYTPYIWVDNGVALIGGRTVFGFAKQLGTMVLPAKPTDAGKYSLETLVVPTYGPNSKSEEKTLLEIHYKHARIPGLNMPDGAVALSDTFESVWTEGAHLVEPLLETIKSVLSGKEAISSFDAIKDLMGKMSLGMQMVFCKQFPSANGEPTACYQAVVESALPIVSTIEGGFLWDAEVDISAYDSHQIVNTLGLSVDKTHGNVATVSSLVQGYSKFSAMVQPGRVIRERS